MANLSITAANVSMTADTVEEVGIAGEALTPGQPVYFNPLASKWLKAEAGDTEAKAQAQRITLTSAALNARVLLAAGGKVNIGATVVRNTVYVVSQTSGLLCPLADLATDDWVTIVGIADTTSTLKLMLLPQGYQTA